MWLSSGKIHQDATTTEFRLDGRGAGGSGDVGEVDPAADALGEEGIAVGGGLSYHVVQLAVELERDDTEQVRPHHERSLDQRGRNAGRQVGADRGERGRGRLGARVLGASVLVVGVLQVRM